MCGTSNSTTGDLQITDANASCACCAAPANTTEAEATAPAAAVNEEFLVSGMTCGHCVSSVTEELSSLDGVEGVDIKLNAGGVSRVTVASAGPIDAEAVRAAVSEAGYDVVTAGR